MMNSAQGGTPPNRPFHSDVVHFTDANGNRQAGVRAVEPPPDTHQAVRGSLYAVVELYQASRELDQSVAGERATANIADLTRLAEQLLGVIQATYYGAKGAQSQVLEAAILAVHQSLQESNSGRGDAGLRAGVSCAALLNNRLLIMTSGPALSFIITDDAVQQFPSKEIGADKAPGGDFAPDQHTYRRELTDGAVLFLGGRSWLQYVPVRTLLGVITQAEPENAAEIANYLGQESNFDPIPGLMVLVGTGQANGDGSGETLSPQQSMPARADDHLAAQQPAQSDEQSAPSRLEKQKQSGLGGLPTSVNASPPIRQVPPQTEPNTSAPTQASCPAESAPTPPIQAKPDATPIERALEFEQPLVDPTVTTSDSSVSGSSVSSRYTPTTQPTGTIPQPAPEQQVPEQQPIGSWHSPGEALKRVGSIDEGSIDEGLEFYDEAEGAVAPTHKAQRPSFSERLGAMAGQAGDLIQSILPERASPEAQAVAQLNTQSRVEAQQVESQQAAAGDGQRIRSHAAEVLAEPLAKMQTFQPPKPTSGRRARLFITAAVLLAILVPVIVFTVVWQRGANVRAEANMLVEAAQASALSASAALDLGDKAVARSELTKAQETLREATALIGNRPEITQLSVQIEKELQNVLQIVPLYKLVEPLIRFPPEASPHRVMVVDQDIYVLDQGRNLIQRYRLDASLVALADSEGEAVLRLGDVVDGVSVGPLVDISWQPPVPGVQDKANLLVLDSNNNVFKYNQRVEGAAILPLGGKGRWQNPLRLQTYLGRLYVADGATGQIFRYNPGQYEADPDEWMNSPIPQGLSGLQSMFIDGNIWILLSNGRVLKYSQGVQEPFALDSDVGMVTEPVDMFIGDQDQALIYVADAGASRILVYDKDGSYQHQFQAPEGSALRDLRSIFVDEVTNTIFILTKSSLFQHPLAQ